MTTKYLLCSDIHNNILAVEKMRNQEINEFEAIIVAGDFGSGNTSKIFNVLSSFGCPVLYVFGNWDYELKYDEIFGINCHHLHLRPIKCGPLTFVGFSGCPTQWGQNPFALRIQSQIDSMSHNPLAQRELEREILESNKVALREVLLSAPIDHTVVVTHERLARVGAQFEGIPLFLFGHIHRFAVSKYRGQNFVNVAALDRERVTLRPKRKNKCTVTDFRNISMGNYGIMEWISPDEFNIRRVECDVQPDWKADWLPLQNERWREAPFLV